VDAKRGDVVGEGPVLAIGAAARGDDIQQDERGPWVELNVLTLRVPGPGEAHGGVRHQREQRALAHPGRQLAPTAPRRAIDAIGALARQEREGALGHVQLHGEVVAIHQSPTERAG
jgi:hypothetical protein